MVEAQHCSTVSQLVQEPLYGTVAHINTWFLLEYNGVWGHEAIPESDIPREVIDHLESLPNSRILIIRQPGQIGESDGKISFFIAASSQRHPQLYSFQLDSYQQLLNFDLEQIVAGHGAEPSQQKLYAICTNKNRDECCARHGVPLYNSLKQQAGTAVWQSTHIGGHRFAATMLCFPHAIGYGHLSYEDANKIYACYEQDEILLSKYRGRSIYPKPVQAADYFLRLHTGLKEIDDVRVIDSTQQNGHWQVNFLTRDEKHYEIIIHQESSPFQILKSCGDLEHAHVPFYRLDNIQG